MESADALPIGGLLTIRDELNAAKVHLNQQIDKLVTHLAYLHSPPPRVHRLPPEVWGMILQGFGPWSPHQWDQKSLLPLLLVCRKWYDIITGSPQLWGEISTDMPYEIARLAIDRSQKRPISVDWRVSYVPHTSRRRDLSNMLDLAIANSTRIRSLAVSVPHAGRKNPRKLLEAPTPALETLQV